MRFMVMHKVDAKMEAGAPPDQKIVSEMGALVQEGLKNGVFLTGAGLHPSAKRARLKRAADEHQVTLGPYAGDNELLSSFAMIKATSMQDAVSHARDFARASGASEVEVGPVVEPWDLGLIAKPSPNVPQRFLFLSKADAASEAGESSKATRESALQELRQALAPDGGVLAAEALEPSAKGVRLSPPGPGKRVWTDGPFAESKELIAGFSIIEVPSLRDAVAWADRYAAVLGGNQVDVRKIAG
ncbi:MAG: YciI family protein [Pseudomonadota bacterium]